MHYRDCVSIAFNEVETDAFETDTSTLFDYVAAKDDAIFAVALSIELRFYEANHRQSLRLDCRYDPESLPKGAYGHPAGDEQLRLGITRHITDVLPIDKDRVHFSYAIAGRQNEGLIVMEAEKDVIDQMNAITSHEWIELTSHPQVARLILHETVNG